jgi:hypothetical protein
MCDGQGCRRETTVRASLRGGVNLGERQPAAACIGRHGGTTTGDAEADKTKPARPLSTFKAEQEVPRRTAAEAQAEAAGIDRREMLLHLLLWGPN